MKITKEELTNIIKEEVEKALGEQQPPVSERDKVEFIVAGILFYAEQNKKKIRKPNDTSGTSEKLDYAAKIDKIFRQGMRDACFEIKNYQKTKKADDELYNILTSDKEVESNIKKYMGTSFKLEDIKCYGRFE
jgi:hypothetical protein